MKTLRTIFLSLLAISLISRGTSQTRYTEARKENVTKETTYHLSLSFTPPPPPPEKTTIAGTMDYVSGSTAVLDCKYGSATAGVTVSEFKVRYNLFKLMGEPVWTFEFKYKIDAVSVGTGLKTFRITGGATAKPSLLTGFGVPVLSVNPDLWNRIRLSSDFGFRLYHMGNTVADSADKSVSIQKQNPGILGRPGEWGWDVPGSPDWSRVFVSDSFGNSVNWLEWDYLGAEAAKGCWKIMCKEGPAYWKYLMFHDLKLDLADFFEELKKSNPQAAEYLLKRLEQPGTPAKLYSQDEYSLSEASKSVTQTLQDGKPLTQQEVQEVARAAVANENGSPRIKDLAARLTALVKRGGGNVNVQHLENAVIANRSMELLGHFGDGKTIPPSNSKSTEAGRMEGMVGSFGNKSDAPVKTNSASPNSSLQHILDNF